MNILQYIIESSVCWAIFFLFYAVFLRKETFFLINRWYLLGSVGLGLIIPLLKQGSLALQLKSEVVSDSFVFIANGPEVLANNVNSFGNQSGLDFTPHIWFVYLGGMLFMLTRLIRGIYKINQLLQTGSLERRAGYTLVRTQDLHLPFSFFKYVFVSDQIDFRHNIKQVLTHEMTHIRQWHSLDVLILEFIQAIFWFNPLIYLYKKAIHEAHEFIADSLVIRDASSQDYSKLLLSRNASGIEMALTHSFFTSFLKSRLNMLRKKKSSRLSMAKYLLVVPVLLILFLMCSKDSLIHEMDNTIETLNLPSIDENTGELFKVVEEMPQFPGCEDLEGTPAEIGNCATQKFLEYIYENLKYPREAKDAQIEGMVVVQFVVDKTGEITHSSVIRDIGGNCGQEAKRLVDNMNSVVGKWVPGYQRGKAVDVLYTIPFRFQLNQSGKFDDNVPVPDLPAPPPPKAVDSAELPPPPPPPPLPSHAPDALEIFKVVEQMPRFPGCESDVGSDTDKEECAKQKMLEYIYRNLKYPEEAKKSRMEGMVVVQFVIKKNGSIDRIDVVRDIGAGCGTAAHEAVAAMNLMPDKWTPGYQRGKAVDVLYTLPVRFQLQ